MTSSGDLRVFSTLREKILSAPLLASGEPKPSLVLVAPLGEFPGIMVRGAFTAPVSLLRSANVLYVLPFPVRRVVNGLTRPGPVRVTGSTTATLLVTGSMIRFVTMPGLVATTTPPLTTTGLFTTTTVVKLRAMKKPENQKPNHQLG
jgi:hypothetical protein